MRVARSMLGLLFLTAGLCGCTGSAGEDLYRVARADLPLAVEATGTLRAVESTSISPPFIPHVWNLKITRMVPESSQVKEGQPILSFDTSEVDRELEQKRAERDQAAKQAEQRGLESEVRMLDLGLQLAEARGRLRRARLKVEVPEELESRVEMEQARLDLELAEAEVVSLEDQIRFLEHSRAVQMEMLHRRRDRADLRVRQLEEAIQRMTVQAPRGGLIIHVANRRGEKHEKGDTVSRMDKILEIPDLSQMEAEAEIDEVDAGRVEQGQRVILHLETHPDRVYTGQVKEIAPTVRRRSWRNPQKVYKVTLSLDETDGERMRPGMRFRADIEIDRILDVLVIPLEAIRLRAGGPVVIRPRGTSRVETPVELGARNATMVEVKAGLGEGESIVRRAASIAGKEGA